MPHFEIRQLLLGHEEVFTNLKFIDVSTLPYELRPSNRVELDNNGQVLNVNNQNYTVDSFSSLPQIERIRINKSLRNEQMMTENQLYTYKKHGGKSVSYDKISIFSLRPPELLYIFQNPVDYFRYCSIDQKSMNYNKINDLLDDDIRSCSWIDCLGRLVKIRILALDETLKLIEKNLNNISEVSSFQYDINTAVMDIINLYKYSRSCNDTIKMQQLEEKFIDTSDMMNILPIPVLSDTSPVNSINF